MDRGIGTDALHTLVVSGCGSCVMSRHCLETDLPVDLRNETSLNVEPWLKTRKSVKFMGKQDKLAVIAAGRAIQSAGLSPEILGSSTGLYLVVGYIPFERAEVVQLAENSCKDGKFSMELFSTAAIGQVNPLLTFRCLPNMPAYHISANFGIRGRYFVSYPGSGQFYQALRQAALALQSGTVQVALVGAVADQDNFLVEHHRKRLHPQGKMEVADAAGFICLEKCHSPRLQSRSVVAHCKSLALEYLAPDLLREIPPHEETLLFNDPDRKMNSLGELGPAALPVWLSWMAERSKLGTLTHHVKTVDGFNAASIWEMIA